MKEPKVIIDLKPIPEAERKSFYDINFVAKRYNFATSKLRFWEKSFPIIQPQKNRAGDREYTYRDIEILDEVYNLVEKQKFTLPGAAEYIETKLRRAKEIKVAVEKLEKVKTALEDFRSLIG